MTTYYPIVLDVEASGAVSAYVPGLPVYAAADTRAQAEQAIRATLTAYLAAHPKTVPKSTVRVARVGDDQQVHLVGVGALLGTSTSRRKARASQLNGRLGGRPRTGVAQRKAALDATFAQLTTLERKRHLLAGALTRTKKKHAKEKP